ncbi:MAG: chemotaxis protein CheD [Candidatus Edwardsbacteria bacterium]
MLEPVKVKIADFRIGMSPEILATSALGSCLAIILYDAKKKIGGLAHVMLPDFSLCKDKDNPAKFPVSAIDAMVEEMKKKGTNIKDITAKLVGGANMFANVIRREVGTMNIGERNIRQAKEHLQKREIPLVSEDTGGDYGRSLEFYLETGLVIVKSVRMGNKEI